MAILWTFAWLPTSIFCLVWLFWTGRKRFRRSKSTAGIIKGTDTANKSWNIFFEILEHFFGRLTQCEWPCIYVNIFAPSALLWFSSTMQPHILEYVVLNTNGDSWRYMNLDFLKAFFIFSHQRLGEMVELICGETLTWKYDLVTLLTLKHPC